MSVTDVMESLQLSEIKDHEWSILPSCSLTGQGLEEAVDWFVAHLDNSNNNA